MNAVLNLFVEAERRADNNTDIVIQRFLERLLRQEKENVCPKHSLEKKYFELNELSKLCQGKMKPQEGWLNSRFYSRLFHEVNRNKKLVKQQMRESPCSCSLEGLINAAGTNL